MAYEIIDWKNKGETGAKPINRDNLRHMDNGILNLDTYKAEIMPLLTVSDTAPVECERGDLYYNTTTELIYVATQPNMWSEEGATPSTFNLYIDLSSSKLYYYDGTNFNSYGSGDGETFSTNEIRVGTWMNKPLYRKVFTGNVSSSIEHGLINVNFVNSYGYITSGGGAFVPLPSVRPTNAGYYIGYYVTNQYIIFDKAADANGVATITLEYTKTTD